MILVIYFIIIVYVSFFTLFFIGFCLSLGYRNKFVSDCMPTFISIVIPVRNESHRLTALLNSLELQNKELNNFELIFIDDHSSDNTLNMLQLWSSSYKVPSIVISLNKNEKGKKNAIVKGVRASKGDYILSLDADVSFDSNFLYNLSNSIDGLKDFYIIPVVEKSNGFVFSVIESYILSLVTIGSANFKSPLLSNGAAMLYRKSSFIELNPFLNNQHILSGDDIFLLQNFKNNNKNFGVFSPNNIFVFTEPPKVYKQYVSRALRWSGKMKFSTLHTTKLMGFLVLITNYTILVLLLGLFFFPFKPLFVLLMLKFLIDFIGLLLTVKIYGNMKLLLYSPLMLLFYPIHLLILFVFSLFKIQTSWKGRLLIEKN